MLAQDVRTLVIRPALQSVDLYSKWLDSLVFGTGLCESNYSALKQRQGPALGFFQVEPATYADDVVYLTELNPKLGNRILKDFKWEKFPIPNEVVWNIRFAAVMCAVHYLRHQIPVNYNALFLYQIYKKYYNSIHGASTQERCLPLFEKAIREF